MTSLVTVVNHVSRQAAAYETPACTSTAPAAEVGALPVVAARALTQGGGAMEELSSALQVRHSRAARLGP